MKGSYLLKLPTEDGSVYVAEDRVIFIGPAINEETGEAVEGEATLVVEGVPFPIPVTMRPKDVRQRIMDSCNDFRNEEES